MEHELDIKVEGIAFLVCIEGGEDPSTYAHNEGAPDVYSVCIDMEDAPALADPYSFADVHDGIIRDALHLAGLTPEVESE